MIGPNQTLVGTCSCCRGPVTVPTVYWSVVAPTPKCNRCGAVAQEDYGPMVPMRSLVVNPVIAWPSTTLAWNEAYEYQPGNT